MEKSAFHLLRAMERSWWYRGRSHAIRSMLARSGVARVADVLDFGAGFGGMYKELSSSGEHVYAFEPDRDAANEARKRGYRTVFLSDTEALARTYDLVGLFDVVEHIEDDRAFLVKMRSALKDGGHLAITVPAFQFLWSAHDVEHHHFRRYTRRMMEDVLRDAGFIVERASYWNMALFIPAALMRLLRLSGSSTLTMGGPLDALFFIIVRVEAALIRWLPLPFGISLVVVARKR